MNHILDHVGKTSGPRPAFKKTMTVEPTSPQSYQTINHPKQLKAPKDSPPSAVFLHFTIQIPKTKQNFRFCGNKNKKLGNGGLKTNVPSQKKVLHGKVVDWKKWRHYHCPAGRAGLDSLASTASSTALKRSGFGDAGRSGAAWDTQAQSGAVRCT